MKNIFKKNIFVHDTSGKFYQKILNAVLKEVHQETGNHMKREGTR